MNGKYMGSQTDDLIKPCDIVLDKSGTAYIVDKTNKKILIYTEEKPVCRSPANLMGISTDNSV